MNRTFIVGDFDEHEFGQWAQNEMTGEKSYVDDERSCFWTRGRHWVCLAVQTIQGPPGEKEGKRQRERKIQKDRKSNSKVMNKHIDTE